MPMSIKKHKKEKVKPDRGVSIKQSKKVFLATGICVPVGAGKRYVVQQVEIIFRNIIIIEFMRFHFINNNIIVVFID